MYLIILNYSVNLIQITPYNPVWLVGILSHLYFKLRIKFCCGNIFYNIQKHCKTFV